MKLRILSALRFRSLLLASLLALAAFGAPEPVRAQSPATMADYWAGRARWSFVRKWSESGASHIEFWNGAWYLFERYSPGGSCPFLSPLGTQVRRSTDQGATWSAPVPAVVPTAGTPWECAATDGDAIYDASNNKWRFLFQCMGADGIWKGCYAERAGADPMGAFTPVANNPVLQRGSLWNRICDTSQDDCSSLAGGPGRVFDEGTFNIFLFDGTYYWVSFHGYDGVRGYRGIAKTSDFVNWIAGDPAQGVPGDAVVDLKDALGWREGWASGGPIGAGAGSILIENGIAYLAVEVADVNLGCTPGQSWDWGLFRSFSLSSTSWEQLPQNNPFVYSSRTPDYGGQIPPCSVAYGQLFRDPVDNAIYFKHFRVSGDPGTQATYLYKLVRTSNVLKNGDLWMGGADFWQRFSLGPTNLVVYRDPAHSADGNQYLATNCGQPSCQPGQSVYQDANVAGLEGDWYTFGGKFATETGTGDLDLVVHQLDASFNILRSDAMRVNADPAYRTWQSGSIPILPGAAVLRYQPYLLTGTTTFRADEMFTDVTPVGSTCSPWLTWDMNSPRIGHVIGRTDLDGWSANVVQDVPDYLQFGPYTTQLGAGSHIARWLLLIDNNSADNLPIVRLEVSDYTAGGQILASRDVTRTQWGSTFQYGCFTLPFTLDASRTGHLLELRVWWYGRAYVREQRVGVD